MTVCLHKYWSNYHKEATKTPWENC